MRKKVTSVIILFMILSLFLFTGCSGQTQEQTQYPIQ